MHAVFIHTFTHTKKDIPLCEDAHFREPRADDGRLGVTPVPQPVAERRPQRHDVLQRPAQLYRGRRISYHLSRHGSV